MKHWVPLLVALPLQAAASWPAAAATPPSEWQQRLACTGDAFRLCASEIPDRARIRACLGRAHAQLSDGCRRVYDASIAAGE